MSIRKTPTYNRVGFALSVLVDVVEREMEKSPDGIFSFSQMQSIMGVLPSLLEDKAEAASAREKFSEGISILEEVASDFPEVTDEISGGLQILVMGMFQIVAELVDKKMENEAARMAPLMKVNAEKEALANRARSLASKLWAEDKAQVIRITQMAANVYAELHGRDGLDALPANQETIKDWIKAVAPSYARKGGKPKKTT